MSRRLQLFYIAPLLAWMAVIFMASTHTGSAENSFRLLRQLLAFLEPEQAASLSGDTMSNLNFVVRKMAHMTEYAILTALALRAWQFGAPTLRLRNLPMVALFSIGYALTDEFHQRFVSDRTPSLRDVAVDSVGVLAVLACAFLLYLYTKWESSLWTKESQNDVHP